MKVVITGTYEEMSKKAANHVMDLVQEIQHPVLCAASGDSPKGLYRELNDLLTQGNIDISGWSFLSLDEWAGMNGDDEGSCRFHLDNDLFRPLGVASSNITFFDGKAAEPEDECARIENFIEEHGGIDVAIVGLGVNGHVGMNEPGTPAGSRTHVAEIHESTQAIGQKYFKDERTLTHGLTLGIASLMEARCVILIVSGTKKAAAVQQVLEGEISEDVPASLLRNHKNAIIYLDSDAASLLKNH